MKYIDGRMKGKKLWLASEDIKNREKNSAREKSRFLFFAALQIYSLLTNQLRSRDLLSRL